MIYTNLKTYKSTVKSVGEWSWWLRHFNIFSIAISLYLGHHSTKQNVVRSLTFLQDRMQCLNSSSNHRMKQCVYKLVIWLLKISFRSLGNCKPINVFVKYVCNLLKQLQFDQSATLHITAYASSDGIVWVCTPWKNMVRLLNTLTNAEI